MDLQLGRGQARPAVRCVRKLELMRTDEHTDLAVAFTIVGRLDADIGELDIATESPG